MKKETNSQLLARYRHLKAEIAKVEASMKRCNSHRRTQRAKWGGCLTFTLLQVESELRERGLMP